MCFNYSVQNSTNRIVITLRFYYNDCLLYQIAIMGCIVNGPGEMADADFGYVGGAPGKIDLYVGKVISTVKCSNAS